MASAISRRQQVRNERLLQDLIKTVPGNDLCADCGARNPGWASWSLGIFLCMRCAALHRKLGTHISKVKSLSMDSWSNEHIENMKRIGNIESNRTYNPRSVKPSIPIDIDEVDGAMERYIRQKYEHRVFSADSRPGTRQNTGSTSSVEDRPPPLPPKPTKKFGFGLRAASSTFPVSRPSSGKLTPPISPSFGSDGRRDASPPRVSKPSRVFGSNVERPGDSFESKLATLRDMGFLDEKRNATVLKGLNGNLERAVEALMKLGDGSRRPSRTHTPNPYTSTTNGISIDRNKSPPATKTINPFDLLDKPQPPTPKEEPSPPMPTQPTAIQAQSSNAFNPFLTSQSPQPIQSTQQSFDQAFQNLSLAQAQPQPLFPHSTGGYTQAPPTTMNPFLQSFTPPPVPQLPMQYGILANPQNPYQVNQHPWSPQSASSASPTVTGNPFLRNTTQQVSSAPVSAVDTNPFGIQNPFAMSMPYQVQAQVQPQAFQPPQTQSPNPFLQQQQQQQSPSVGFNQSPNLGFGQSPNVGLNQSPFGQPQMQPQVQPQGSPFASTPGNPFQQQQSSPLPQQMQGGYFPAQPVQQQPVQQQPAQQPVMGYGQRSAAETQASILALYNYPQLAPARPADSSPAPISDIQSQGSPLRTPQRSVTMPNLSGMGGPGAGTPSALAAPTGATAAAAQNPFASSLAQNASNPAAPQYTTVNAQPNMAPPVAAAFAPGVASATGNTANGVPHFSRDSVDFAGLMAGRHSPDAFKGLSSRWGVS